MKCGPFHTFCPADAFASRTLIPNRHIFMNASTCAGTCLSSDVNGASLAALPGLGGRSSR
jgi:hypothetical protein